jgi:dihydrofolate reductase
MRRLVVFDTVSLDGYFVDASGDMSWAHKDDPEWNGFVADNASTGGTLVFGRVTYELMASFWPTPQAMTMAPLVAKRMNHLPKIVFSRTLDSAAWSNTKIVKDGLVAEIRKMKREPGKDLVVLGSGSIVSQLAQEGLVDEFQIVVNPIVLGKGRTLFEGVSKKLSLKRTKSRAFDNGNVYSCYAPTE